MTDIFMKIDGIPGDSKDAAHLGEIEVLSWTWRIAKYRPNDSDQLYGNGKKGVGGLEYWTQHTRVNQFFTRLAS